VFIRIILLACSLLKKYKNTNQYSVNQARLQRCDLLSPWAVHRDYRRHAQPWAFPKVSTSCSERRENRK
jgi:hypothetical protein